MSKKKVVLSPLNAEPFANWTAPVPPTDEPDPPPTHVPKIEKQPVVRFTPLLKVEVPPVRLSCAADTPPAKVLVPCPRPTVIAAAKVEVAEVEVAFTTLNWPKEPKLLVAKKFVVVAFVPVAFTKVKFWKVDCPATPVEVAVKRFARISPKTSSVESDVVALAPIKT